tara:strand:+ start:949 stop:1359 length:411 start_codon:yes stop_codon:yes gene_type:complete
MSLGPKTAWADMMESIEIFHYNLPEGLFGTKVTSLDELKEQLLPDELVITEKRQEVGEGEYNGGTGFTRYQTSDGPLPEYVAYKCPACRTIIMGPPKIEKEAASNQRGVSQDRITYFCGNCNEKLYTQTGMRKAVD